jgi:hypothetical protein
MKHIPPSANLPEPDCALEVRARQGSGWIVEEGRLLALMRSTRRCALEMRIECRR